MHELNRKIMFGWVTGLFLFLWIGYFFGYFVATDQAMTGLKQREEDWDSNSKALKSRANGLSEELARLKVAFADQEGELKEARQKIESLKRELGQAQSAVQTVKQPLEEKISLLEEALTMKSAQLRDIQQQLARNKQLSTDPYPLQSPLTIKQIVTAKEAFNDIQHEVAVGNFKGLNLTTGYQRLRTIFDNPDLDQVIGLYDAATGRGDR